ncbi:MAG: anti-sigma factor [Methylobacteriaceae bacterium]|nr:anti-sigma factor [Methylobacteriaceae bacterium]
MKPEQIYEIDAYADGELDPMRALAVEKLMAEKPELRQRYESIVNLRTSLRAAAAQDRASDLLRPRVERSVGRATPLVTRWAGLAASFLFGLIVSGALTWGLFVPRSPAFADMIVSAHMRSLLAEQPFDIASSDRHTVKPWLARKVPQSPDVIDLTQNGFPLIGGRVDVIDGEPVATVVYGRAKHLVSLMTFAKPIRLPADSTIAGFHIHTWPQGSLTYVAVSDIPESELAAFENDVRHANP